MAIFSLLHGDYTISSLLSETRHFSLKISRFFMSPVEIPIKVLVKSTVYRRVMCLFRLQKETFEGLSQEALSVCIRTLKFASSQIATKTVRHTFIPFDLHVQITRDCKQAIKQGMFF